MIDPFAITDFDRDDPALEELFLFCCSVAGKKATMIAAMVDDLLANCGFGGGPFDRVRGMLAAGTLGAELRRARLGKYGVLERCFAAAVGPGGPDIRTAPPAELERLPGIGPKTSRFFILHSRRGAGVAVIDTHVLKYLRDTGVARVPDKAPTGPRYAALERIVLADVAASGMAAADFDLAVWSWYASGGKGAPPFAVPSREARRHLEADGRTRN
jgi:hypothetical protein